MRGVSALPGTATLGEIGELALVETLTADLALADDVLVGSPVANRNREEIEGLIGFFVNTLVFRLRVRGEEGFLATLERTPRLAERLFTDVERGLAPASLAARFAAKEALAKALGAPGDLHWHDAEVVVGHRGRPHLEVRGSVAGRAAQLGVSTWHLSLSHDGGIASAVVVAEGVVRGDAG